MKHANDLIALSEGLVLLSAWVFEAVSREYESFPNPSDTQLRFNKCRNNLAVFSAGTVSYEPSFLLLGLVS